MSIKADFMALFAKARATDPVYYALSLGMAKDPRPINETILIHHLNKMLNTALEQKGTDQLNAIFLYQQFMEAKAVYILLKNICNCCRGIPFQTYPFTPSFKKAKKGAQGEFVQPSTPRWINEVSSDFATLGFLNLAKEFEESHVLDFRHAFAHSNYYIHEDTSALTVLRYDYQNGEVGFWETTYSDQEFHDIWKRFFKCHLDFADALREIQRFTETGEKFVLKREANGTVYHIPVTIALMEDGRVRISPDNPPLPCPLAKQFPLRRP